MTKEIYTKLKEYENIMKYAVSMDYLRVTPDVFKKLADIYKEHTGKALTKMQMNCNSCRLKAIKELGKDYAAYVPEVETEVIEEVVEKPKAKRGRPKKNTNIESVETEL